MSSWRGLLVLSTLALAACGSDPEENGAPVPGGSSSSGAVGSGSSSGDVVTTDRLDAQVGVAFGADVPPAVKTLVLAHLRAVVPGLVEISADREPELLNGALHLSFGSSATSTRLQLAASVTSDEEAFAVKSETLTGGQRAAAFGAGGRAQGFAAYALLEELGFAFLHPLAPTRPPSLSRLREDLSLAEAPRWHKREIHLHTMHPLELTELLQGWGTNGPEDAAGFEAMLPEWDTYLEWLLANRQNGVEWFLLWADSWKAFADGPVRAERLRELVQRTHDFQLRAGIDTPIVFAQQHAFTLLRNQGELGDEIAEIQKRMDYVLGAGFDFMGIESGTSEFTSPNPQRMLDWMNAVTDYADKKYEVPVSIKVHASTGQTAEGFTDPNTGGALNFNFLPHYADPRLGVLPHTVQHYGLTDPAPTYGNTDFGYIRDFLRQETGTRPVLWYPESAYWVSFDVDVPLFLPIYAERRLADLRIIQADENQNRMGVPGAHMDGQLLFSSGWEWGYWLNDVIAARAAWNPGSDTDNDARAFQRALAPVVRPFGDAANDVAAWITESVDANERLLIRGEVAGQRPANIEKRNGQAYLQGWETWDDVSNLSTSLPVKLPMTQPAKVGLVDMRNPAHGGPGYTAEIDPLLAAMETEFGALADRADTLRSRIPAHAKPLFDDLADAARMTALRAVQVRGLYLYVDDYVTKPRSERLPHLVRARAALDRAQGVVAGREAQYRVPAERIASWRPNPTAYAFNYLWTVHSLFFFWRDEGKAVDAPVSPCYLNTINPVDIAFGEGFGTDAARFIGEYLSSDQQRGCLAEPSTAPTLPPDGLRSRP